MTKHMILVEYIDQVIVQATVKCKYLDYVLLKALELYVARL